ncbi:isocitrate lyase/PEP mutase family protein [Microvirga makkahensis]|uniref:Isocitrate lyase/phosphoenolpyruvate mutase family protein n=1 Tax=Microvirga makkahensis TaxID=1128670 RepID=A0A7X3MW36_9HYPH|nr:isocitrate lyase/phosphoenolpyruvate mutase family protein [Microvirga makkahensis]MXQ14020.1 isocitrate lyase/phosphoenolpyruvate mutase family protein [Microvirga makkahensis]
MSNQTTKAHTFRSLHVPGRPLILFNVWDVGSAKAVAASGAKALATGSWSVAAAHGFTDGEQIPFDLCVANLQRIVGATDLPVTIDLESGYGADPAAVRATVACALQAGIVGCNIEDSFPEDGSLRDASDQAARLKAARSAADALGIPTFLNARTDVFFQSGPEKHDEGMVEAALERGRMYADAGADGLFVPGLIDERLIGRLVEGSPLPVNIMAGGNTPPAARLAELGVSRISHGPRPYLLAMCALENAARAALEETRTFHGQSLASH